MRYAAVLFICFLPSLSFAQAPLVQRAITLVKTANPFDAPPSNADLVTAAENMVLANSSVPIPGQNTQGDLWAAILQAKGLVINPSATGDLARIDIGTMSGETFTPATNAQRNDALAAYVVWFTHGLYTNQMRLGASKRKTTNAGETLTGAVQRINTEVKAEVEAVLGETPE